MNTIKTMTIDDHHHQNHYHCVKFNLRGVVVSCRFWSNECHFQATTRGATSCESLKVWCLVALDSCSSISVLNHDEHSIDGKDLNFAGVAT